MNCSQILIVSFILILCCSKMTPGKVNNSDNASNADSSLLTDQLHKDDTNTSEIKDVKKPIVSFDSDISSIPERSESKQNDLAQKQKIDDKLKLEVNHSMFSNVSSGKLMNAFNLMGRRQKNNYLVH